ncbi:siderophore ABC transporter substrate-binding protein [Ignatzschineria rhizosphaerae]|uniref:Siderophore ABC transporter substrate-binding protein n=1 Tax=Ignatzschineria rhizosphaerae TaxID=2923279 RepID=A0ABY3X5R9_9GAMM|nr:siderophore ABC transporter substrate-binding protein [Ignatzschineria rhizosphaerae]UNM96812.1 siderophore ABC transporter substrate-binding protein [Ignatzschineria rhizosphaerae]
MKTKMFKRVVIASALALVLAACGDEKKATTETSSTTNQTTETTQQAAPKTVTIKHGSGETVVPLKPEKVISFDLGAVDTLEKIDVDIIGLPKANLPSYLSSYKADKYGDFGSLKEPNFEAIHAAKPDVIIIAARQAALYDQFAEIAPTLNLSLDEKNYVESTANNARVMGKIFDKEAQVEAEIKALEDKVASVYEQTSNMPDTALILLVNDGKISAYGSGSRFGIIHDALGFKSADKSIQVSTHGQTASFEYVMDLNPDYIFVVDRSAVVGNSETSAKQVVENDLVKNTNAYKNNKIIYLDPNVWYLSGGGLKSTTQMVDDVQNAINK